MGVRQITHPPADAVDSLNGPPKPDPRWLRSFSTAQPPRRPYDCGKNGPPPCVPLMFDGLDYMLYSKGSQGRFTVLDLRGGGELVGDELVQSSDAFARGLRLLRPILDGLRLV